MRRRKDHPLEPPDYDGSEVHLKAHHLDGHGPGRRVLPAVSLSGPDASSARGAKRRREQLIPPLFYPRPSEEIVDLDASQSHLTRMPKVAKTEIELLRTWTLPPAATLGSTVRAKGILQEVQARLPAISKKSVALEGINLTLAMPVNDKAAFTPSVAVVSKVMEEAETLPVIPREIQDILTITTSERHRWLADGRLRSAGTRTVRLNGRARRITFHVFDPKLVEDLLDRSVVDEWREEDAEAKAEKRRQSAYKAKLTRSLKKAQQVRKKPDHNPDDPALKLRGWEDFNIDGLLR